MSEETTSIIGAEDITADDIDISTLTLQDYYENDVLVPSDDRIKCLMTLCHAYISDFSVDVEPLSLAAGMSASASL